MDQLELELRRGLEAENQVLQIANHDLSEMAKVLAEVRNQIKSLFLVTSRNRKKMRV